MKKQISKLLEALRNPTARNAQWMLAEQGFQMLISLVLSILTARYLGPSNYGIINYVSAFVAFFTIVCSLGLEGVIIREMVEHRDAEGTYLGTGLILRMAVSVLSIVLILGILALANQGDPLILTVGFLQSAAIFFHAFDLIDFWFQSRLQSKYVSIIKGIAYLIVAVYKIWILVSGKDVRWFAFSTSLDILLIAGMMLIAYFHFGGQRLVFSFAAAGTLLKQSWHFILSGIIITVYIQMDKIMIRHILDETQVGIYSAALNVCNYWVLIPTALINSARPTIMEAKKRGDESAYLRHIHQLYAILIWSGVFVSVFVTLLAPWIIRLLYADAYLGAEKVLATAIWYTTFSTLGLARGIWLVCEDKNRYVVPCVIWGAVINVILNAWWIPVIGINGAALATLVTQVFNAILAPMLYRGTRVHTRYIAESFLLKGIRK